MNYFFLTSIIKLIVATFAVVFTVMLLLWGIEHFTQDSRKNPQVLMDIVDVLLDICLWIGQAALIVAVVNLIFVTIKRLWH